VLSENAVQLGVDHAVGQTKGRKVRSVPVPSFVLDELSPLCKDKPGHGLVFGGRGGSYLPRPKSARGWFAGAVQRSKVQAILRHDLKHTCASSRCPLALTSWRSEQLGHTSAKVTLDTYSDLLDADLDAVAVALHSRYSRDSVFKMRSRSGFPTT
jgi:integrase